jgi:hypothetical protein
MAKKIKESLVNSKDIKVKKEKKDPKPKAVKVDQLHPKAPNKDSLTENIQSRSSKAAKDAELGKSKKIPLSHNIGLNPKKKK